MRRPIHLALVMALTLPAAAEAAVYPKESRVDGRLRYTSYDPDQVYVLHAAIGRALFIQFAEGEEMERFYTGDSAAWEVGKHANLVAIKPTAETPDTNLIVSTTAGRVYTFDLGLNASAPMYGIRFSYPNEERKRGDAERLRGAPSTPTPRSSATTATRGRAPRRSSRRRSSTTAPTPSCASRRTRPSPRCSRWDPTATRPW